MDTGRAPRRVHLIAATRVSIGSHAPSTLARTIALGHNERRRDDRLRARERPGGPSSGSRAARGRESPAHRARHRAHPPAARRAGTRPCRSAARDRVPAGRARKEESDALRSVRAPSVARPARAKRRSALLRRATAPVRNRSFDSSSTCTISRLPSARAPPATARSKRWATRPRRWRRSTSSRASSCDASTCGRSTAADAARASRRRLRLRA